jgi:hypothetical protein
VSTLNTNSIPSQNYHPKARWGLTWWALALSLGAMFLLSGCGGDTPAVPDPKTLIQDAQKAITTDTTYHYKFKVEHSGTGGSSGFQVTAADGDVVKPDKVQGTGTVAVGGASIEARFIGIGQNQWVLAPPVVSDWTSTKDLNLDLGSALSDPTGAVTTVLSEMKQLKNQGDDTIPGDGDCWVVEGTVPAGALASITGGDPNSTAPLDTTICVAKNLDSGKLRQLFELSLKGMAIDGDTAQTTRTFTFTKFNSTVDIEPPPGVTPTP